MGLFRRMTRCLPRLSKNGAYFIAAIGLLAVASYLRHQAAVRLNNSAVIDHPRFLQTSFENFQVVLSNHTQTLHRFNTINSSSQYNSARDSIYKFTGLGYQRAAFLNKLCANDKRFSSRNAERGRVRVSYDASHNALFCPLCKMASTFWTRVFVMLSKNRRPRDELVKTPFHVPISQAPASEQYLSLSSWKVGSKDARDAFKFLFVRNPFAMIFSAYVDKIVGPNPFYWKTYSSSIFRKSEVCGSDLAFSEFLQNIKTKARSLDCHVAKYSACHPCGTRYTYVAKMETFKEDTFHILEKLGQNQSLEIFQSNFSSYHAEDAIDDSVNGPFSWKEEITRCISWPDALRRVWRKLQIRGAIGNAKFPLTDEEAENVSEAEFKDIIRQHGETSTLQERNDLKRLSFIEAYQSVPVDMLNDIKRIYWEEFALFDYNSTPDELFKRGNSDHKVYGFLNYSNINEDVKLLL